MSARYKKICCCILLLLKKKMILLKGLDYLNTKRRISADKKNFKIGNLKHFKRLCKRLEEREADCQENLFVPQHIVTRVSQSFAYEHEANNFKLSPFETVVIFLQFVTGGESFSRISRRIGLTKTTVSTIVSKVSNVINQFHQSIHLPQTPEEWRKVEATFERRDMLRALGSLDGKHIRIRAPPSSGSLFYNYKSFFSFVLLALVDAEGRFLWIDVGTPGSVNDATIFNSSNLKKLLEDGENLPPPTYWSDSVVMPSFVIADGIFPLMTHLMKPYSRRGLSEEELLFNRVLSGARVKVEHSFGFASGRFRILKKELECSYKTSVDIVNAVCNIHNIILGENSAIAGDEVNEAAVVPYRTATEQRDALTTLLNEPNQ